MIRIIEKWWCEVEYEEEDRRVVPDEDLDHNNPVHTNEELIMIALAEILGTMEFPDLTLQNALLNRLVK